MMEPIAIVGLAGRFPGAEDVGRLWQNLRAGRESITSLTEEELVAAGVPPEQLADPAYVRVAARMPAYDEFDAGFFGLTPREARFADPQLRALLEVAHTAVEDSGHNPFGMPGAVGVFAAMGTPSYQYHNLRAHRTTANNFTIATSNNLDYVATQLSYKFNFTGPSMTVVTACSSSLTAVHLGCQSLRLGECDMALAGGANIEYETLYGYWYEPGGVRSRDGHCRPFDSSAGGTVFGAGAGMVVLKRLADAEADGDHIRAVVLGTGINNDGRDKVGYAAPSMSGQIACVQDALVSAGVGPSEISYVEAHGTGTALGDPIEIAALAEAWRRHGGRQPATGTCPIGSIKSNIGHAVQAAGVAGLLKLVLALEHGEIPPSINFDEPNPKLELDKTPFFVADSLRDWPQEPGRQRLGAISSLGAGGTNVHLVVGEGPEPAPTPPAGRPRLVVWSGRSAAAVDALRAELAGHFAGGADGFEDSVTTLQRGRRAYPVRRALVSSSAAEAAQALAGDPVIAGETDGALPVVFAFPGQGSLFPRMGRDLYGTDPVFTSTIDHILGQYGDQGAELLRLWTGDGDADRLVETALAQRLLFAVEYALTQTWQAWGIRPAKVLGHSVGELVAATVAGVFGLDDAVRLVQLRADAMQRAPVGAMAAVFAAHDLVAGRLPVELSVAAVNGPAETVVSGPHDLVRSLLDQLRADGVRGQVLRTSHAFHSPAMAEAAGELEAGFDGVRLSEPKLPLISAATGRLLTAEEARSPRFWAAQVSEPVWFARALRTLGEALADDGRHLVLELGPGRALSALMGERPDFGGSVVIPVLPKPTTDASDAGRRSLLAALGTAWSLGAEVDWAAVDHDRPERRTSVPSYPYQRERHWVDPDGQPMMQAPQATRESQVSQAAEAPQAPQPSAEPFSVLTWVEQPRPETDDAGADRSALVLLPEGRAEALEAVLALQQAGLRVHAVRPGDEYAVRGSEFRVRASRPADLRRVFDELAEQGVRPEYLVHASTLGRREPAGTRTVFDQLDESFLGLLHLVQQAGRSAGGPTASLVVLTSRSVDVSGSDEVDLVKSTLHGQIRTLALEAPQLESRLIDVGPGTPDEELADELRVIRAEAVVALRGARRWVRREVPFTARASDPAPIRKHGVYLITGGTGGLGLAMARGLARTGLRPSLVLLSRTGLPDAAAVIEELEELGARALVFTADVADKRAMRRALDVTAAHFGPVNGVLHLAGVAGDGMLALRAPEAAAAVLRPKVVGTLVVRELLADRPPLDFFVSFSSRASVGGLVGSGDYAAGNAFLDADAVAATAAGQRTLSINWPGWSEVGMAAEGLAAQADPPETGEVSWDTVLDAETTWALDEHRLNGTAVLPGTAHLDLVLRAFRAKLAERTQPVRFDDVVFSVPLAVPSSCRVEVRFTPAGERWAFSVGSERDGERRTHVTGRIGIHVPEPKRVDVEPLRQRLTELVDVAAAAAPTRSFTLGPRWQVVAEERHGGADPGAEKLLTLALPERFGSDLAVHPLHPTLLDAATSAVRDLGAAPYLPFHYQTIVVHSDLPATMYAHVHHRCGDESNLTGDIDLIAADGTVVAEVTGFRMRRFDPATLTDTAVTAPVTGGGTAGLDTETGVRLCLRLLGSRTPPQVVVRPFENGKPVPLVESAALTQARHTQPPPVEVLTEPVPSAAPDAAPSPVPEPGVADQDVLARMRDIWIDALGLPEIGADDDFFDIGGTSLTAVELMSRIRAEFDVELSIAKLLDTPSLSALSAAVMEQRRA